MDLMYSKTIVEILKYSDSGCWIHFFQNSNYLAKVCWTWVVGMDGIQSWLHEVLGNLHVNMPTLEWPMETSKLQTSLVWNSKAKLDNITEFGQNFHLVVIDSVHNIAMMHTAWHSILFRTCPPLDFSVSFTGEFSPNFDLKNMIFSYSKDFAWEKWLKFARFRILKIPNR
jgi:hypothetical protein